ncbi:SAM-dependent methyltransferase [Actinoplanes friuliensis]|uniref:S-adenosyl methyltransferase n=1 Tax=Actinoplanes friuliensis DSM 7358 TaxID=1246995 RepID=U5W271_9ACTN|nr:SAM-dependent methyltransferase [Actinoplanes friuliensis]AGZ43102.1 hypothetical protein AFR_24170 [Actinoplanes friuliensis DSM 7358]
MAGAAQPVAAIDPNRPSTARIYDYLMGGSHNFAADRAVATRAVELLPELPVMLHTNRSFLRRAVRYAAGRGIRQFLELGSGIPTAENVHGTAREVHPDARVVYVDIETSAVLHAREALREETGVVVVQGDLLQPRELFTDPGLRGVLDLTEPVCIILASVLHFVPDSPELVAALRCYREVAAPGSHLVLSHVTAGTDPEALDRVAELFGRTGTPLVLRDPAVFTAMFQGWEPVEPGIVPSRLWHPGPEPAGDGAPAGPPTLAGVAVKM